MTIPAVKIPITAEDRFSRTFAQLKRDLGDVRGVIGSVTAVASRVLLPVGAAVAAVGASGAALKRLADDIDQLNDAADATGSSVEKLSVLETIARRNGAGVDLVTGSITRLNQALNTAKPDSPAARALQALGLQASALRQLDPADALREVAQALAQFEDNGAKARITQELFGRSVREVAPFLRDLLAAGELNARVTARQAEEAARFSKAITRLQADLQDASRGIALRFLPALNEMFVRIQALRDVYGGLGRGLLENFFSDKFSDAGQGVRFYGEQVRRLQADVERLRRGGGVFDAINADKMQAELGKAQRALDFYRRVFSDELRRELESDPRYDLRKGRGYKPPPALVDPLEGTETQKRQTSEAERYLEVLQRQAEGYGRLSAVGKLFADIEAGRIDGLTPKLRQQLLLEASRVDALDQAVAEERQLLDLQRALNAEKEKEAGFQKLLTDKRQRDLDEALALLEDTTVGRANRAQRQIESLRELLELPGVDADRASQILEAIDKIKAGFEDLGDTGEAEFDRLKVTIDRFAENSVDAITEFVVGGERSFDRLFQSFQRDLLRALIEDPVRETMRNTVKAIQQELAKLDGENNPVAKLFDFLKGLGNGQGGGGAGFWGWFSGLFSAGAASTGRAGGGGVNAGQLVRWQEGGREWFVPQENGTVLTQAQLRQMQGASLYAPTTINVNGDVSPATVAMVRRMLEERDARLARSMQHGRMRAA